MTFEHLQVIEPILKALHQEGYDHPTPIQQQAIPIVLERKDLIGCARTGTGKTAAFAIPILQMLHAAKNTGSRPGIVKCLVLSPTRELALQIQESFEVYGKYTGLKTIALFGGVSKHMQVQALRRGADIVVATPGRLLDLINDQAIRLNHIELLVLDEADRMLDMGFIQDIRRILKLLPVQKQTLFFSATMDPAIRSLASSLLRNPVQVAVTPVASAAETIQQHMYFVQKRNKPLLLKHLLTDKDIQTALVFTRTKHGADKVAKELNRSGIPSDAIHGNKSQPARQHALHQFRTGRVKVLVATDIAARGIDVDELTHVINFELPEVPETYVHRIGRTGRAGASGTAFSFCDAEERILLRDIQKLIASTIPVVQDHPFTELSFNNRVPVTNGQHNPRPAFPKRQARKPYPGKRNYSLS